jgi:hypothetical protein
MPDIAHEAAPAPEAAPATFDQYNYAAQRVKGVPEAWHWSCLKSLGEIGPNNETVIEIKGGIPSIYKSGPRKGQRKLSEADTFLITTGDVEREALHWESVTGSCWKCSGSGQVITQFSVRGNTYGPCKRCEGTGKASTDQKGDPA